MRLRYTLFLSLFTVLLLAQKHDGYIVKVNMDTVFVKGIKIDRHMKQLSCDEGGRKIKYKAKDLLSLKKHTTYYETGFVRLRTLRSKCYRFLEVKATGYLNLYETDACKGSWALTGWAKHKSTPIFFYKKQHESRKEFSRSWKQKTKDCKFLKDKVNSQNPIINPKEIVEYYNGNCVNQ